jgi:hypothetical protein
MNTTTATFGTFSLVVETANNGINIRTFNFFFIKNINNRIKSQFVYFKQFKLEFQNHSLGSDSFTKAKNLSILNQN